jgi:hypothetical protein
VGSTSSNGDLFDSTRDGGLYRLDGTLIQTGQRLRLWLRSRYFADVPVTDAPIVRSPAAASLRIPTLTRLVPFQRAVAFVDACSLGRGAPLKVTRGAMLSANQSLSLGNTGSFRIPAGAPVVGWNQSDGSHSWSPLRLLPAQTRSAIPIRHQ